MATIQEINTSIMFGDFTNDQLDSIITAIKFRRNDMIKTNKRSFLPGSRVKFYSSRQGQTFVGTVEKVAVKFITVKTSQGRWKVPANMLEAA